MVLIFYDELFSKYTFYQSDYRQIKMSPENSSEEK